jgi:drug/metabolite transporter (DMT)-like permease
MTAIGNPPSSSPQVSDNIRSILLMIFSMGVFVLNDTLTKTVSDELPTGQIIAIRGAIASLILVPLMLRSGGFPRILESYSQPLLIRNASEIVAVILYLSALFQLPIANVTAILQLLPLAMTAAAAVILKEQVGWRRWSAAIVGLLGVALIIRPGTDAFSWWYVGALISVLFITARDFATRFIAKTTPTLVITFLTAFCVMCAGALLGLTETWIWPSWAAMARLTAAACLILVGYAALIEAWRGGEVSATAPFRYTVVVWAIIFGYLFLGEIPSWWTVAGSAIVVAAGLYTFHRERIRNRQPPN